MPFYDISFGLIIVAAFCIVAHLHHVSFPDSRMPAIHVFSAIGQNVNVFMTKSGIFPINEIVKIGLHDWNRQFNSILFPICFSRTNSQPITEFKIRCFFIREKGERFLMDFRQFNKSRAFHFGQCHGQRLTSSKTEVKRFLRILWRRPKSNHQIHLQIIFAFLILAASRIFQEIELTCRKTSADMRKDDKSF